MSDESADNSWNQNRGTASVVVLLLLVHAALCIGAAFQQSVTNDEFWHIPTGFWNVTHGKFHYENLNPPLLRGLAAAPLVAMGAQSGDVPEDADKETRADAFVAANRENYSQFVSVARIVPILLSVATAWMLATWALELFGKGAAALVAAMWCLSPNVIAHASLVTTDVSSAGAMLLIIRSAWRLSEEPSWSGAIWLGIWLGLGQLVKFTCLLAYPLVIAVWLIRRTRNQEVYRCGIAETVILGATTFAIALAITNVGYLFQGSLQPLGSYTFQSQSMQNIAALVSQAGDLPVPFPGDYIEGIDHQRHIMEGNHPSYLDGEMRFEGGFPDYYVKAWWYKAPHASQVLVALGLIVWWWPKRQDRRTRLQLVLLLPIGLLLFVASRSSMQLGLRYLLPAFPFAFLFASQLASVGKRMFGIPQLTALLLAVGVVASVRHHPNHLSYFNEYSGGPENGHEHLLDSNIDWGQGLLGLKTYMEDHQIETIGLAYFGAVNPKDLGINFVTAPQSQPPAILWPHPDPGVYAISANFLMGRPGMVRAPDGTTRKSDPHQFGYFRVFEPTDRIGNNMFIYKLSAADIARMPSD